jgi:hypothetical protein
MTNSNDEQIYIEMMTRDDNTDNTRKDDYINNTRSFITT